MMVIAPAAKPARNRIDISSEDMARHWCKRLRKSRLEIEAAIAKVGDNAQTVIKELNANQR
jgi:Protein of unknown function (DUF3606)